MYESFFGLSQRPFSTIAHPGNFVAVRPAREALDSLLNCITQSRGIGVITADPGFGKTMVCKRLAQQLSKQYNVVYLSSSGFHTRRALLQAILYELGIDYVGLTEEEARLRVFEHAKSIAADDQKLLIIADEAHLLQIRLFEELRTLADFAPDGVGLIHLVLSGHFELEEILADPSVASVNQRIGCHATLERLSLVESAEYLAMQLQQAGADIEDILTEPALEALCHASDGNPRCLSQLADQSLLLAYAEERQPIDLEIIRLALNDVKELPLTWNDLDDFDGFNEKDAHSSPDFVEPSLPETDEFVIPEFLIGSMDDVMDDSHEHDTAELLTDFQDSPPADSAVDESVEYAVLEVGGDADQPPETSAAMEEDAIEYDVIAPVDEQEFDDVVVEIEVNDPCADLDRCHEGETDFDAIELNVPKHREELVFEADEAGDIELQIAANACEETFESSLLETVNSIRDEIINQSGQITDIDTFEDVEDLREYDVVQPVNLLDEVSTELPAPSAQVPTPAEEQQINGESESAPQPQASKLRKFQHLFTRLRERRQSLMDQQQDS